jgi:hypothetical protein
VSDIVKGIPDERRMGKLQHVVQTKLIGGLDAFFQDSPLDTLINRVRRFSIGQGDIMTSFFKPFAEVYYRLGRPRPLPIAEKMKDLQSGFLCMPAPVPTEGGAGRPMNSRMASTTVSISESVSSGKRGRERIS